MLFINRKEDLKEFENYYKNSKNSYFPVVLFGQRRVGKTRLIKEFSKNKKYLYFFVDDSKHSELLLKDFNNILHQNNLIDEFIKLDTWDKFVYYLLKNCRNHILIFDEFQNFQFVEPSIFSIFQHYIDEFENESFLIIFLGSIIGLMKELFENQKKPLFGRIKGFYHLKPFSFKHVVELCKNCNITNFKKIIEIYSIFGGYPRYYVLIKDYNLSNKIVKEIIKELILKENAVLKKEVINTLKLNFGQGKLNYYSILESISQGNTKTVEIANYIGQSVNATNFFLNELKENFAFVEKKVPITDIFKKNSKITYYKIENNFFDFYFKFIHKNSSLLEFDKLEDLENIIEKNFSKFVSFKFENICFEFLKEIDNSYIYGSWWNRQGEEIDIVAINEEKKEILFAEVKWQDNVDANKILRELKEKSKLVKWNNENRKEKFVLFAKSFKDKNILGCTCYDLIDMEKVFK